MPTLKVKGIEVEKIKASDDDYCMSIDGRYCAFFRYIGRTCSEVCPGNDYVLVPAGDSAKGNGGGE